MTSSADDCSTTEGSPSRSTNRKVIACKERAADFIFDDVDRAFSRLPKYAQRTAVTRFKRSLFDKRFPLPNETFEDHLARAKVLPRAVLAKSELRLRRKALETWSRDRFAAFALMKSDQTLWIHG